MSRFRQLLLLVCLLMLVANSHAFNWFWRKDKSAALRAADDEEDSQEDAAAEYQWDDESDTDEYSEWYKCDQDVRKPRKKLTDVAFWGKIVRNLNPFKKARMHIDFYLFKREFPECGREMNMDNEQSIKESEFDPDLPTRIVIHGWMSQSYGSFNRDVKAAYLQHAEYNVIVSDWSASATNLNYFAVVDMIEVGGAQLAQFTRQLHNKFGVNYDDIYLIGHSLGAQIAGAAGKYLKPAQYNTIFALDPAGPQFRQRHEDFRINPSNAKYVEAIQTSANLGFLEPTGNATFYPNYGRHQQNCGRKVGCSHKRAYLYFAESINSPAGFWGISCDRADAKLKCDETRQSQQRYIMGGEPSTPKNGVFLVKTAAVPPYALGRNYNDDDNDDNDEA